MEIKIRAHTVNSAITKQSNEPKRRDQLNRTRIIGIEMIKTKI